MQPSMSLKLLDKLPAPPIVRRSFMTPTGPMHVPLRDLPATRDISLSSDYVGAALAGMPMRAALERPDDDPDAGEARATVELHGDEDDNVFVRGQLRGWFEVACSRCIGTVRVPLDESLAVTYVPKARLPDPDEDADLDLSEEGLQLHDDDLDLYGYEGEQLDLEPLLREQLILAVPFAPLCSESCKGLCPQCGIDRNVEVCACEPPIDPRLAALRTVKL